MSKLTTGELARRAGVGVQTVLFYERQGLLEEPPRRDSGYREYPPESLSRLLFIRRAKELGFSLKEIRELLSLTPAEEGTCEDVQERLQAKIASVEEKIQDLQRIQRALAGLAGNCVAPHRPDRCPFLAALDGEKTGGERSW